MHKNLSTLVYCIILLQTFFKHELTKQSKKKMLSPFPKVSSPNAEICTMYFPNVLAAAKGHRKMFKPYQIQ